MPAMNKDFHPPLSQLNCSRGAPMGRPNSLPSVREVPVKLSLRRLKFVDGCYDAGGAYWGLPENLWRATGFAIYPGKSNIASEPVEIFIRASTRENARATGKTMLPNCHFYR
jgi:hypothetical protein